MTLLSRYRSHLQHLQGLALFVSMTACDSLTGGGETADALTVRGPRGFTAVLHGNWRY